MELDVIALISNYGFPIAVSTYLILFITRRLNSKLDKLINEMEKLNKNLQTIMQVTLIAERVKKENQ